MRGLWVLIAIGLLWVIVFSGADQASTILYSVALILVAPTFLCFSYAIEARRIRPRLMWIGRALALLGAATAIAFPGILYAELVTIVERATGDPEVLARGIAQNAIWMPFTVIPALLALRWTRVGGYLFLLNAGVAAILAVDDPFNAFPDRDIAGGLVFDVAPRAVTAVLLIVGGLRPARERRRRIVAPHAPGARPA